MPKGDRLCRVLDEELSLFQTDGSCEGTPETLPNLGRSR